MSRVQKVLFTQYDIDVLVNTLANKINMDYCHITTDNPLVLICILKGSVIFFSDLTRKIMVPQILEFLTVTSYQNTESTGDVKILSELRTSIEGKHVIIIEDILDTGLTLDYLMNFLQTRNPKSLECCVLLRKPTMIKTSIKPKYVGVDLDPPEFVVGYGLDYNELYRNLPYIGVPYQEDIKLFTNNKEEEERAEFSKDETDKALWERVKIIPFQPNTTHLKTKNSLNVTTI